MATGASADRLRCSLLPHGAPAGVTRVELSQAGILWLKPGGRALRFRARQWMDVTTSAFVWDARVRVGFQSVRVTDAFEAGRGRLDVRLPCVRIAHAVGRDVDLGEVSRYLAELPWAPHALVANPEVHLRSEDDQHVILACALGDTEVAVRMEVDEHGAPVRARMPARPRSVGKRFEPTPWLVSYGPLEDRAGVRVPMSGEAAWELPEGRFTYWRGRITAYESVP
ncbi:MAG: hypothetical protein QNJ98_02410 [Planctomycetota bacterium]|nr:hypothetical protein [Planctomycetota bacterium]